MFQEMNEIVLSYPKIVQRLKEEKSSKKKVLKNLKEIRAEFSEGTINVVEKLLNVTLPHLYDGINFNDEQVNLSELMEKNSVVLVPNHQSHMDYLAINYKFFQKFKRPLYVAGGINLNVFPIGKMFRSSGCFFIRRSFNNDITYKLTLEAYLFYLIKKRFPIEFFFEGGRSRTGKLRPPRFGLYHMLLEAHSQIEEKDRVPLAFIPVSMAHEYVPEQKTLARELKGAKKKKESTGQMFKLLGLFSRQFGNVHINLGTPIYPSEKGSMKQNIQDLAFKCFIRVGKNMLVTPSSLLILVLLDEPTGAMQWQEVLDQTRYLRDFCNKFGIPTPSSLDEKNFEKSMERACDILVGNKRLNIIGDKSVGHVFYSLKEEARPELLYFKNTIIHHFLVPSTIYFTWIKLFDGSLQTVEDLKELFVYQRDRLKLEFYLPSMKEFIQQTLRIISDCVGRKMSNLEDCLSLNRKELYLLGTGLGTFSQMLSYLDEVYYVVAKSILLIDIETQGEWGKLNKADDILKKSKDLYAQELKLSKFIKYPESFSTPSARNVLKYLEQLKIIEFKEGRYKLINKDKLTDLVARYALELKERLVFNFKVS
jgi:glycerol-3-phosphate O-acyltransferase